MSSIFYFLIATFEISLSLNLVEILFGGSHEASAGWLASIRIDCLYSDMDLSWDVIQLSLIIVGARVLDVSIGILRIISVVRGRRLVAVLLGFLEALIWVFAISKVTAHLDKPIYMVAFAFGFSLGNFVGLTLERRLAYGNQVIRIFTRLGSEMAEKLRDLNYKITIFNGKGRAGPIDMLLLKTSRKEMPALLERVRGIDAESFYFVDDITLTSDAPVSSIFAPGMFRLKRK